MTTDANRMFVDLATDWRVFAFTGALAAATCVIFCLAPAIRATAAEPPRETMGGMSLSFRYPCSPSLQRRKRTPAANGMHFVSTWTYSRLPTARVMTFWKSCE